MTYRGTNTWLLDTDDGQTLIDPGPDDAAHVAAILAATSGSLRRILLTHTHPDHVGAAAALQRQTGAPILGWGRPWLQGFMPDRVVEHGEVISGLTALHTPGHASDHVCFAWDRGGLFSGDHVMSWNTSIVSPPDGDMAAYLASLRVLIARDETVFYCGHGPVLHHPQALMRAMLGHRLSREGSVFAALKAGATTPAAIVERLYAELDPGLKRAAERTVLSHLIKLQTDNRATEAAGQWAAIPGGPGTDVPPHSGPPASH